MFQKQDIKNYVLPLIGISASTYILWKFFKSKNPQVQPKSVKIKELEKDDNYMQQILKLKNAISKDKQICEISKNTTMQVNKTIYYILKINYNVFYQKNKQKRLENLYDIKKYGKEIMSILSQAEKNLKKGQSCVLDDLQLEEKIYEQSKLSLEQESHQYAKYQNEIYFIQSMEQVPSTQIINKEIYDKILDYRIHELKKIDIKRLKTQFDMSQINQIISFYLHDQVYQKFGLQTYDIFAYQIDPNDIELLKKEKNVQNTIQSILIQNCQFPY